MVDVRDAEGQVGSEAAENVKQTHRVRAPRHRDEHRLTTSEHPVPGRCGRSFLGHLVARSAGPTSVRDLGDAGHPPLGGSQLLEARQVRGRRPQVRERVPPSRATTASQKRWPSSYWRSFISSPIALLITRWIRCVFSRRLSKRSRMRRKVGITLRPDGIHHVVPVPFDHGHQCLHPVEQSRAAPRSRRDRRRSAPRPGVERDTSFARGHGHATCEALRIHLDRREVGPHEIEERVAQPRHAGELESVSDLVHRDPQREVLGDELHALRSSPPCWSRRSRGMPRHRASSRASIGDARIGLWAPIGRTGRARDEICSRASGRPRRTGRPSASTRAAFGRVSSRSPRPVHERCDQRGHSGDVGLGPIAAADHRPVHRRGAGMPLDSATSSSARGTASVEVLPEEPIGPVSGGRAPSPEIAPRRPARRRRVDQGGHRPGSRRRRASGAATDELLVGESRCRPP